MRVHTKTSDAIDRFAEIAPFVKDRSGFADPCLGAGRSLLVWDNGIGMIAEAIRKLKTSLTRKRKKERSGLYGHWPSSGIAVAKKAHHNLHVAGGILLAHKFEIRARDMKDDIAAKKARGIRELASEVIHTSEISTVDVDAREHYTLVELRDIEDDDSHFLRRTSSSLSSARWRRWGSPLFAHGKNISLTGSRAICQDYRRKWFGYLATTPSGFRIYRPYKDKMNLADPNSSKFAILTIQRRSWPCAGTRPEVRPWPGN